MPITIEPIMNQTEGSMKLLKATSADLIKNRA